MLPIMVLVTSLHRWTIVVGLVALVLVESLFHAIVVVATHGRMRESGLAHPNVVHKLIWRRHWWLHLLELVSKPLVGHWHLWHEILLWVKCVELGLSTWHEACCVWIKFSAAHVECLST